MYSVNNSRAAVDDMEKGENGLIASWVEMRLKV